MKGPISQLNVSKGLLRPGNTTREHMQRSLQAVRKQTRRENPGAAEHGTGLRTYRSPGGHAAAAAALGNNLEKLNTLTRCSGAHL